MHGGFCYVFLSSLQHTRRVVDPHSTPHSDVLPPSEQPPLPSKCVHTHVTLTLTLPPFPQLFGHEIVAILCGVVWGIWIGFGIVAAGTALGELANF